MGAPEIAIDVDSATGVWQTDGVPMVYLPRHFLVNSHKATEEALGRHAYSVMIRHATDTSAYDWCRMQAARMQATTEEIFRLYFKRLSQRGWGLFHVDELNTKTGEIRMSLHNSVFVLEEKAPQKWTLCYMFEGFLTGATRFLIRESDRVISFDCCEMQCAGQGHSTCRFEVRRLPLEPGSSPPSHSSNP